MHHEQRARAHAALRANQIDRALFANPQSVTWLTGFSAPPQTGPNAFLGGPALVWYADGHFTLIVLDSQADAVQSLPDDPDVALALYEGYSIKMAPISARHLAMVLRRVVNGVPGPITVSAELQHLPVFLQDALLNTLPAGSRLESIDGRLEPLRMVKTPEEIALLRANFALTAIGQAAARAAVRPGIREIDVWTEVQSAIERAAGERVPLGNDCVVGSRTNNIGGWPGALELRPGDSLLVDLSVIRGGYWSDSCATYYAGEPDARQLAMHCTVEEALAYGISLVRPGAVAREIDQALRAFLTDRGYAAYPHHSGHAIGVSGHENPRIVPYAEERLREGMIIMLEPGIYIPGETSVRLELGMLVTATGNELLAPFDQRI